MEDTKGMEGHLIKRREEGWMCEACFWFGLGRTMMKSEQGANRVAL